MNTAIVLLACTVAGLALYFGLLRPLFIPLTQRIPHERKYQPGVYARLKS